MGLFDKLRGQKETAPAVEAAPGELYAPVAGSVIPLEEIPDPVFSAGAPGPGCGIEPSEGIVVSPVNGTITTIMDTKHAVGITSEEGTELLIHVGMDTVEMGGDGFTAAVKSGDKVVCGQTLLRFDMEKIRAAGHPVTTAFVVLNADQYEKIEMQTGRETKRSEVIGTVK